MKLNKIIFVGIVFILLAAVIFLTNILNPIIRPVTYLFLMGSSKGKDILFFGLFGLFLILSQAIKKEINTNKYLKISIIIGFILLILGIFLEIIFRLQMGISLNTVFCSVTNQMSSTSILHTHLLKSILGELLTNTISPVIPSDINTGVGLYSYIPDIAKLVILLIPLLFIFLILSNQKRTWIDSVLISFSASCLIIGSLDGGLFSTPAILGIFGLCLVYRNGYYINHYIGCITHNKQLLKINEENQPVYRNKNFNKNRFLFNRILVYLVLGLIILLRFTIAFAGAECDYYTVEVVNPIDDNVLPFEKINQTDDKITYKIDSNYNEMELINDLKIPLYNNCKYYTVSWNIYSYF